MQKACNQFLVYGPDIPTYLLLQLRKITDEIKQP